MSLVSRFKSPTAVKQFLDSADGMILVDYMTQMRDKAVRTLRKSNEPKDIFYAQGAADGADVIVKLRQDIVEYQSKIASGEIKSGEKEKDNGILEQE